MPDMNESKIKTVILGNVKWILIGGITIFTLSIGIVYKPNINKLIKTVFNITDEKTAKIIKDLSKDKVDADQKISSLQIKFNALQAEKDKLQKDREGLKKEIFSLEAEVIKLKNKKKSFPKTNEEVVKAFKELGYSVHYKECN